MFSFIVVLISIALVILIALATIHYGGDILTKSSSDATANALHNEGAQIKAAFDTYRAKNHVYPKGNEDEIKQELLDKKYLRGFPDRANGWSIITDFAVTEGQSDEQCLAVNKLYGIDYIPSCDAPEVQTRTACCAMPED